MESQEKKLGFTEFAETWNGRLAMLGFIIGIATELLTYTALNAATNSAGTYSTRTSSDDNSLYAHAEDHDIPISEGSLVYLANVVSDNREVGAFGEWITDDEMRKKIFVTNPEKFYSF